ncbi:hypothetical protein Tco_0706398 [Tanacetum coccineum]|uniref:Retrotransposon gag protein n=1 Tax=Tanacetum coccineum TaxID=301880 RepID=A0ABQ4XPV1_9ASTR
MKHHTNPTYKNPCEKDNCPKYHQIPFPQRLKKEKEEAQQQKFLENLKQLQLNIPFTEALAQMPKYAKFLKSLLSNKTRLEEACTEADQKVEGERSDFEKSKRRIKISDTAYSVSQETQNFKKMLNEHLCSASAKEIDEKKPELKDLPSHLEYVYLNGDRELVR